MAVTMTAELADCFATKREGVVFVLDAFRTAFPDVRAVGLRRRRTIPIGGGGAATTAPRRGRQLDGERDARGAHVSRRALPRRRQHDDRRDPDRRGPRGRPGADGPGPAPHRRARLHGGAAHAGLRHRALGALAWPPVPRGRRALRHRRRRPSLAGTDRGGRLHLRDAGRPGPGPRRGRRTAGADGLRRSGDARSGRHHGDRGARRAGPGAADRGRRSAGDAAAGLGLSPAWRFSPDRGPSWRGPPRRRSASRPATWPKTSDRPRRGPRPRPRWRTCWRGWPRHDASTPS